MRMFEIGHNRSRLYVCMYVCYCRLLCYLYYSKSNPVFLTLRWLSDGSSFALAFAVVPAVDSRFLERERERDCLVLYTKALLLLSSKMSRFEKKRKNVYCTYIGIVQYLLCSSIMFNKWWFMEIISSRSIIIEGRVIVHTKN